ncbi:MAG: DpnD/PcfM family protein [Paludibacteraceae bacterium]
MLLTLSLLWAEEPCSSIYCKYDKLIIIIKNTLSRYLVNIEEVLSRDIIVEAESAEEAEYKVEQLYRTCGIVLDAGDFVGTPTIKCRCDNLNV